MNHIDNSSTGYVHDPIEDVIKQSITSELESVASQGVMNNTRLAEHLTNIVFGVLTQYKDIPGYQLLQAVKRTIWGNPILSRFMFFANIIAGIHLTWVVLKGARGFLLYAIKSGKRYKKASIKEYNSYKMGGGGRFSNWVFNLWPPATLPVDVCDTLDDLKEEAETDSLLNDSTFDSGGALPIVDSLSLDDMLPGGEPGIPFIDEPIDVSSMV